MPPVLTRGQILLPSEAKRKKLLGRTNGVLANLHISNYSLCEHILEQYKRVSKQDAAISVSALAYAIWQGLAEQGIHKDPRTIACYLNVTTKQMLRKAKQFGCQSRWQSATDSVISMADFVGMSYKFACLAQQIITELEGCVLDKTPEVLFASVNERYLKTLMTDPPTLRERLRGIDHSITTKQICKKIGVQWRHVYKVAASLPELHITKVGNRYVVTRNKPE